jgi:hypothetical protein
MMRTSRHARRRALGHTPAFGGSIQGDVDRAMV